MKRFFMILGTCLMAAAVVVSCNKPGDNPKPDDPNKPVDNPDDPNKPDEPAAFSMEVAIDGDFSDWDVLTADKADDSYVFEENTNPELNGLLCVKATSDKDYIYLYTEIDYENVFVAEDGPYEPGNSNDGFHPSHPGTPGPLWVWIDGDGDATGAVSAYEEEEALWGLYAGFDAPIQYYFCYDAVASKMQIGWQQVNWPIVGGGADGTQPDVVFLSKDSDEWGRAFIAGEDWNPASDWLASTSSDIAFSAPMKKGDVTIVKMEIAISRTGVLPSGDGVKDQIAIGVSYENKEQGVACAHGYLSEISGKIPSGNQPFKLVLINK